MERIKSIVQKTFKVGYSIREDTFLDNEGGTVLVKNAYTLKGDLVGDPQFAFLLYKKKEVFPEKIDAEKPSCTIGFCEWEKRWFGWSESGISICSFGIGDKIFEKEFTIEGMEFIPLREHGCKTITTLEEARQAAANFAESLTENLAESVSHETI